MWSGLNVGETFRKTISTIVRHVPTFLPSGIFIGDREEGTVKSWTDIFATISWAKPGNRSRPCFRRGKARRVELSFNECEKTRFRFANHSPLSIQEGHSFFSSVKTLNPGTPTEMTTCHPFPISIPTFFPSNFHKSAKIARKSLFRALGKKTGEKIRTKYTLEKAEEEK